MKAKLKNIVIIIGALISATFLLVNCRTSSGELSETFTDPPGSYRPGAFWCWLNGNMTKESISRDLKEMSEKGMGRAEIWDVAAVNNPDNYIPAGPSFLSDSSVALIRHAFAEGKKYGIKIGMVGSSGWNAGGTWVEPDWASKQLFFSSVVLRGPVTDNIELPFPDLPRDCPRDQDGMPVFYREVAVLAMPYSEDKKLGSTGEIIDLTSKFSAGKLDIDLPLGNWIIMRFINSNNGQSLIVPSPKSGGLFIDFFDPESTKKHLSQFIERLGIQEGGDPEGGLAYLEFDSMELAEGISWTDSMPSVFREMRGYDLTKYLPVLAGWSIGDESDKFLYDWTKTISDRLIFSHYTTGREFLEKYNIDLVAEAGGPGPPTWNTCPVDALKALGNVSVPRGEFWVQHRDIFLIKEISSASHIYGRNIVDAESFTTWRRWKDSPYDLKKLVDRAFCEGLNFVTFHTFASTPPEAGLPGRTYHAGSDINPANTWWNKSGPFMDYLSRCSYLLQQGLFVADVCYYYGDQAPNFYPAYHVVPEKIIPEGLGKGYDYDVVNSDVILNRMSVKDGRIVLPDGLSYAIMVLPEQDHMPLEILKRVEEMVQEGATIIGNKPLRVPYLNNLSEDNTELAEIADRMWGMVDGNGKKINAYGKGRVIKGITEREILISDGIYPDFELSSGSDLDYIHRKYGEKDIYFIRNKSDDKYTGECSFRLTGKYPELWDPSTGEQHRIKEFEEKEGRTHIDIELDEWGSAFLVFNDEKRGIPATYDAGEIKSVPIDGSWRVEFPEGWGAPREIVLDNLISWTESDDQGVRYFSGTATYHQSFSLDQDDMNNRIQLDLGQVHDLAEIFVNEKPAGILWKPPFIIDITELVREGSNDLRIEVVNQWVNRLTGDMLSVSGEKYCRTNQPYVTSDDFGFDNWLEGGDETFRVMTSGLLGPVYVNKIKTD